MLAALCVGYFIGGVVADRHPSAAVLGVTVLIGSVYILVLPLFSERLMEFVLGATDNVRTGSLAAAFAILFFPVTFLGMYSPFGIRLLLRSAQSSGRVSGTVYGVSTLGSIVGTLGTTFLLIPSIGTRAITLTLGVAGIVSGLLLVALPMLRPRGAALALAIALDRVRESRRARQRSGRSENPRRHAQARRRAHRAYRDRIQRHLHHQARPRADDVVPAQGIRLHRIDCEPCRSRTTCRSATRRS